MSDITEQWKTAYVMVNGDGSRERVVHWHDTEQAALRSVLMASQASFVDSSTIEYEEPEEVAR